MIDDVTERCPAATHRPDRTGTSAALSQPARRLLVAAAPGQGGAGALSMEIFARGGRRVLGMRADEVQEVVSFYPMFTPAAGRAHIQVCTNICPAACGAPGIWCAELEARTRRRRRRRHARRQLLDRGSPVPRLVRHGAGGAGQ